MATVYVPGNSIVHVRSFTNAAYLQKITLVQENGISNTFEGSGEEDNPLCDMRIKTGNPSSPQGYKIDVEIDTSADGGKTWTMSDTAQTSASAMFFHMQLLVSEDEVDSDWNDCVVMFSWWEDPSKRIKTKRASNPN